MKKINILLVIGLSLTFSFCKKEDGSSVTNNGDGTGAPAGLQVSEENTAIVNKVTATWCSPCGAWGWDLFEEIISENGESAIYMGTYGSSSSNFTNTVANTFYTAFGANGYPSVCVDGANEMVYVGQGIDVNGSKEAVGAAILAHKAAPVLANSNYSTEIDANDTLIITTKTKFFTALTGTYKLAAYLVEDSAMSIQAYRSPSTAIPHPHVLRGSANGTWGKDIATDPASGKTVDETIKYKIPSSWNKDHLSVGVALVIWKKNGSTYEFVNAHTNH